MFFGRRALPLAVVAIMAACTPVTRVRRYQHVVFTTDGQYQPLLGGPPETGGMRSGRVVLMPGEVTPRHSTERNEEMLVFLAGVGEVALGGEAVKVGANQALYIPPHTPHEVHNTGTAELCYVYTVAPAR